MSENLNFSKENKTKIEEFFSDFTHVFPGKEEATVHVERFKTAKGEKEIKELGEDFRNLLGKRFEEPGERSAEKL